MNLTKEITMTLKEYFSSRQRGCKSEFAKSLGITKTWMSLITSGHRVCSVALAVAIERLSNGDIKREDFRPDIFRR
jgi:hypothetical protein